MITVLPDLFKALDCIPHDLLIAKLSSYNFSDEALSYIYLYMTNRKQWVITNNTHWAWVYNFDCPTESYFGADSFQPVNKSSLFLWL